MSFFDDASLAFLPSGGAGKDTKAYSIKPTDGSGDFTFSRGSNLAATRVGPTGLIEKGRENLLLHSNDFSQWSTNVTTLTSGQTGYDGSSDAWLLEKSAANGFVYRSVSGSGIQTISVYAKANTNSWMQIYGVGSSNVRVYYNLSDGTFGAYALNIIHRSIEDVGNGWYRCSATFNASITNVRFFVSDGNNNDSGTSGSIYIQDAQVEQGLAASEVITTGASTGKAGLLEDEPRFDYSGGATCPSLLLEPSRTNLVPYSEYFGDTQWSIVGVSLDANNTTSVEGLQNAYKITDDTSTGYHKITYKNLFVADGVMRTWSLFVKQGNARYCAISHIEVFSSPVNSLIFDMQEGVYTNVGFTDYFDIVHEPIDMGNGWWLIGFSSDLNSSSYDNFSIAISQGATWSGNLSYTGDGSLDFYIYGAQLEAGSYPTSYIPNHSGGSVTRGADEASATGLSSYIGQTEGTLFIETKPVNSPYLTPEINLNAGGDLANAVRLQFRSNGNIRYYLFANNINTLISVSQIYDDYIKIAITYKSGELKIFINGTERGSTNPLSFPFVGTLDTCENRYPQSVVKQLLIFPTALSDADCINITSL